MDVVLVKFLGDLLLGLSQSAILSGMKELLTSPTKSEVLDEATRDTAREFPNYPNLESTLHRWASLPQVAHALSTFNEGQPAVAASELLGCLSQAEFHINEPYEQVEALKIIATFFRMLEERILSSPSALHYIHKINVRERAGIRDELRNLNRRIQDLGESLVQRPPVVHTSEADIPREFQVVRELIDKGHVPQALINLDTIRQSFDENTTNKSWYFYHCFRGWAAMLEQSFADAVLEFGEALEFMKERAAAHRNLALAQLMRGDAAGALRGSNESLRIEPENQDALVVKAQAIAEIDGWEEGIQFVDRSALSSSYKNHLKGFILHNAKKFRESLKYLSAAHKDFEKKYDILFLICSCIGSIIGEETEKLNDPPWVVTWKNRVLIQRAITAATEAVHLLEETSLTRDKAVAHSYAGSILSLVGRNASAKAHLDYAYEHGRFADTSTLCRLAQAEVRMQRGDRAREYARSILNKKSSIESGARELAELILQPVAEDAGPARSKANSAQTAAELEHDWQNRIALAHSAIARADWKATKEFLDGIITPFAPSDLIRLFLLALYNTKEDKRALELIALCRGAHRIDYELFEFEASIHENRGALDDATRVISEAEKLLGLSIHWQLRHAVIEIRRGDKGEAKELMPSVSECDTIGIEDLRYAVWIATELDQYPEALEIAYKGLLRFFGKAESHLTYARLIFAHGDHYKERLTQQHSSKGSVVSYKTDGPEIHKVLLDNEQHPAGIESCPPGSQLYQSLIDKAPNDQVVLKADAFGDVVATVLAVLDKYVWTFGDVQGRFEDRFPSNTAMRKIRVEGDPGPILEKIIPEESVVLERWRDMYAKGVLPISSLAKLRAVPEFRAFASLTSGEFGPLRACEGNANSLRMDIAAYEDKPILCLETSAALVLSEFDCLKSLQTLARKLVVCRQVIDALQQEIAENKQFQSGGYLSAGKRDGKPFVVEVPSEAVSEHIGLLDRVREWLEENAEVRPLPIEIPADLKRIEDSLANETLGTLAVAKELGGCVVSDDLNLRRVARDLLGLQTSWSYPLTLAAKSRSLDCIDPDDALIKLASSNYFYLPIAGTTLSRAFAIDGYSGGNHTSAVLRTIADVNTTSISAISVVVDALRLVWSNVVDDSRRFVFLENCLNAIALRGKWLRERRLFITAVGQKFHLLPIHLDMIISHVTIWESKRVL